MLLQCTDLSNDSIDFRAPRFCFRLRKISLINEEIEYGYHLIRRSTSPVEKHCKILIAHPVRSLRDIEDDRRKRAS